MVSEVRKEFQEHFGKEDWNTFEPNTNECINIATRNSLGQMFLPGLLVIVIPITVGVLFGPKAVAGLLIGIIISGIQMATSSANTGGAWDNCKKYIKSKKR
jgi:inorganic pyrophosphatase